MLDNVGQGRTLLQTMSDKVGRQSVTIKPTRFKVGIGIDFRTFENLRKILLTQKRILIKLLVLKDKILSYNPGMW